MLEIRGLQNPSAASRRPTTSRCDFADGSLTAVIGPNGAGKSTFFNLITGALKPDAGEILLDGVDLAGRTPPEIVRHGIGRAFQVASIFPSLTVEETMLAAVGADQRRASVLHRRFPLGETRDRAEQRDGIAGSCQQAAPHRGDTVAWRPEAARYRAGAGARSKGAAARRADRRHGYRRALAHDRQGKGALGDAEDHGGLHRARHGHRVQDRARDRRALLRPHSRQRARRMRSAATRPSSTPISAPSIMRETAA